MEICRPRYITRSQLVPKIAQTEYRGGTVMLSYNVRTNIAACGIFSHINCNGRTTCCK